MKINAYRIIIVFSVLSFAAKTQNTEIPAGFFKKEELHVQKKRYLLHNNYITVGPGYDVSNIKTTVQQSIGVDLHVHVRTSQWLAGAFMSGETFGSTNYLQLHALYGYRKETTLYNFAAYAGPSWNSGVLTITYQGSKSALLYNDWGAYMVIQAHKKLLYDIGFGLELFTTITKRQIVSGLRVTAFFSNAYKGKQMNYNPNLRAKPRL
jgi:hypothetical protein